jgi:hypothetical protein
MVGADCCSATCTGGACAPPADCTPTGMTCTTDAQCCSGQCFGGQCTPVVD